MERQMKSGPKSILIAAIALAVTTFGASANSISFQGVTFSFNDLGNGELQVTISGAANATGDWTGIRYLESFALDPAGGSYTGAYVSNVTGWTYEAGGLSASGSTGCNGHGSGWVCFYRPTATPYAIPSNTDMVFDIQFTGGIVNFAPTALKVDFWKTASQDRPTGSLLSQDIPVSAVPSPVVGAGWSGLALASGGLFVWWRRTRKSPAEVISA
jgi:hypothetical protein